MVLSKEIQAVRDRDPAARSIVEILLVYPGLHAVIFHRLANVLWRRGFLLLGRVVSHVSRLLTGIEIHPGATIGDGLFIDHGMGVVIGETAIVGNNVTLYQGVTLGGTGKERGKRHPTVGNNVVVGVGAKILGAVTIGDGARIGGGAVVLKDVPPYTTAVGVPARVVASIDPHSGLARRLERLPDPEQDAIIALQQRVEELERIVRLLEAGHLTPEAHQSLV